MKRFLIILTAVLAMLPVFAYDYTYKYKGISLAYNIVGGPGDWTVECIGAPGVTTISGDLKIPSKIEVPCEGRIDKYTVKGIAERSFSGETKITSVEIPNSVTYIGGYAFSACWNMTSIILSSSLTAIKEYTFSGCTSLTSIEIPNSVKEIGDYAFYECQKLPSIVIPNSVTTIGYSAFSGCNNLHTLTLSNSLRYISKYAFYHCLLRQVVIPESVISIGDYAFDGAWVSSLEIPNSVISIGKYAFRNCNMSSLVIPESVISIGNGAFFDCNYLTTIELPNSIKDIGYSTFSNFSFSHIKAIYYNSENPLNLLYNPFYAKSFYDLPSIDLYVPEEALEKFEQTPPWKYFNIVAHKFPNAIEEIYYDFNTEEAYGIYNLSGVKVADNVETLAPGIYIIRQGATTKKVAIK